MNAVSGVSDGAKRQAWILFVALCGSIILMSVVGYFITTQELSAVSAEGAGIPPLMFIGLGFASVLAGGGLRGTLLTPERLNAQLRSEGAVAHRRVMSLNIVTWALTESMAVFGLVATILSGDLTWVGAASGIALAAMVLWHRPRFGGPSR